MLNKRKKDSINKNNYWIFPLIIADFVVPFNY